LDFRLGKLIDSVNTLGNQVASHKLDGLKPSSFGSLDNVLSGIVKKTDGFSSRGGRVGRESLACRESGDRRFAGDQSSSKLRVGTHAPPYRNYRWIGRSAGDGN